MVEAQKHKIGEIEYSKIIAGSLVSRSCHLKKEMTLGCTLMDVKGRMIWQKTFVQTKGGLLFNFNCPV